MTYAQLTIIAEAAQKAAWSTLRNGQTYREAEEAVYNAVIETGQQFTRPLQPFEVD